MGIKNSTFVLQVPYYSQSQIIKHNISYAELLEVLDDYDFLSIIVKF
jgi:hypothetical protein